VTCCRAPRPIGILLRLWAEWKVLLTGGSIIALVTLVQTARDKPISNRFGWLVLGLTLILSAFFAWRKEWIANGKGFVTIPAGDLMASVTDLTGVYAKIKKRPYINKWIRITGEISEVSPMMAPFPSLWVMLDIENHRTVRFMVSRSRSNFVPLAKGTPVTVAGRIEDIMSFGITLRNVELINVGNQQAPQLDQ
jgi:hypothetical protein